MKVLFLGWCRDGTHDKVWGIALYQQGSWEHGVHTYATFWGRRGKKLQKKLVQMDLYDAMKLIHQKVGKGYREYAPEEASKIYESFPKDIFKVALTVK